MSLQMPVALSVTVAAVRWGIRRYITVLMAGMKSYVVIAIVAFARVKDCAA